MHLGGGCDMQESPGYNAVKRLARERPNWLPVVEVCLEEARYAKGHFAGAWVLKRADDRGITLFPSSGLWASYGISKPARAWFPNLRLLVSYGILKHEDTTRGGRRAYYTMPDPDGVERALRELDSLKA